MTSVTADQFKAAIEKHMRDKNLTLAALARKLGKGESTVGEWRQTGIKRDSTRQQLVAQYPWLFNPDSSDSEPVPARVSEADAARQNLLVLMKTEQARPALLNLTAILTWFLFKASADERNQFRDMLGDDWPHFLELTRAMTNETAFEITKQEGRLEWTQL